MLQLAQSLLPGDDGTVHMTEQDIMHNFPPDPMTHNYTVADDSVVPLHITPDGHMILCPAPGSMWSSAPSSPGEIAVLQRLFGPVSSITIDPRCLGPDRPAPQSNAFLLVLIVSMVAFGFMLGFMVKRGQA